MYIGMEINGRRQRISPHFSHVIIDNRGLTFSNSTEEQVGLVSANLLNSIANISKCLGKRRMGSLAISPSSKSFHKESKNSAI